MRRFTWIFLISVLMVPFQNCSYPRVQGSAVSAKTQNSTQMSGGQPYDGKPFVQLQSCADGTLVGRRVVAHGQTVTVYRENCQSIAPRDLRPDEVIQMSETQVILKSSLGPQALDVERPAIPLPGIIDWFLQLTGTLKSRPASIYIVDMFGTDAATISALKAAGHTVICNISAGTVEDWNPDAGQFLPSEIGKPIDGAKNEHWIDTRSANVRRIMRTRLDLARDKGCHGVDFDAADGFVNNTGFPLTRESQLDYDQGLAFDAHDRGLILTLNSVPELAGDLSQIFDIAVAEQCFTYGECASYSAFVNRDKPVLVVEYGAVSAAQCASAKSSRLSLSYLSPKLDGSRYETCANLP